MGKGVREAEFPYTEPFCMGDTTCPTQGSPDNRPLSGPQQFLPPPWSFLEQGLYLFWGSPGWVSGEWERFPEWQEVC